jgi:hypothetical protein
MGLVQRNFFTFLKQEKPLEVDISGTGDATLQRCLARLATKISMRKGSTMRML